MMGRSPDRGCAVWGKEGWGTGVGADDADGGDVSEEGVEFEGEVGVGGAASEEGLRGVLGVGDKEGEGGYGISGVYSIPSGGIGYAYL